MTNKSRRIFPVIFSTLIVATFGLGFLLYVTTFGEDATPGEQLSSPEDPPAGNQRASEIQLKTHEPEVSQNPTAQLVDDSLTSDSTDPGKRLGQLLAQSHKQPSDQYEISLLLDGCLSSSSNNRGELRALADKLQFENEEVALSLMEKLERCKGVYSYFPPDTNLRAKKEAWLASAAEDGFALAKAELAWKESMASPDAEVPAPQTVLPTILEALSDTIDGPPEVFGQAVFQVQAYLSRYKEGPTGNAGNSYQGGRHQDRLAWDYLGCQSAYDCDIGTFENTLNDYFQPEEIEALQLRVDSIKQAIRNHDWDSLRLEVKNDETSSNR